MDGLPLLSGGRETRQGRQNRTHTTFTQRKSYGFRSTQTGGERECCGLAKVRRYISTFPSLTLLLKNSASCKSKKKKKRRNEGKRLPRRVLSILSGWEE